MRHTRKRAGSVFGSYNKKKKGAWKHKFFCLAYVGQVRIPTSESDAGLGEKDVEFEQLDISPDEFKEVIFSVFPKLRAAGGFQLCKCVPNSRKLEPLSSRVLMSPLLLKQRIGSSKSYIVPLQRDLDLTPVEDSGPCVSIYIMLDASARMREGYGSRRVCLSVCLSVCVSVCSRSSCFSVR